MPCLRSIAPAATALTIGLSMPAQGLAAPDKIGGATSIQRDVLGSLPGQERKVAEGDDVFRDETIRTASASAAAFTFLDETNLRVGPLTSVKLDRFVFNPDRSVKAMAITMAKGAMRWVSGISASRAYEIRTPQVVIGVRGTMFDLWADGRRTVVLLQEGSVEVCTAGSRRTCRTLNRRGDVISVSGGTIDGPRPGGPGPSDFANRCLSATSQSCTITIARAEPAPLKQGTTRLAAKPGKVEEPPRSPTLRTEASPPRPHPARRGVSAEPRPTGPVIREAVVPPEPRARGASVGTYRPQYPQVVDVDIYHPRRPSRWLGRTDVYEDGGPDGYDERPYSPRRVHPFGSRERRDRYGLDHRGQVSNGLPPYSQGPSRHLPGPYGGYGNDGGDRPAGRYGSRGGSGYFGGVGGAGGAGGSAY